MADNVPLGMEFMRWQNVPSVTGDMGGRALIAALLSGVGGGGGMSPQDRQMSQSKMDFRKQEIDQMGAAVPDYQPPQGVAPAIPTGFRLEMPQGASMPPSITQQSGMGTLVQNAPPGIPDLTSLIKKHFYGT